MRCVTGRERGIEKQSGLVNRPRVSIGIRGGGGIIAINQKTIAPPLSNWQN